MKVEMLRQKLKAIPNIQELQQLLGSIRYSTTHILTNSINQTSVFKNVFDKYARTIVTNKLEQ